MSTSKQHPSQRISDQQNFHSLEIISEFTKERVASQIEQVNALDSKANFVLGSATALVSAALVLQAALLTAQSTTSSTQTTSIPTSTSLTPPPTLPPSPHGTLISSYFSLSTNNWPHVLPLIVLILVYFITMVFAFLAYRINVYKLAPDPNELYRTYLSEEEEITKAAVFRAMLEAYNINVKRISKKVHRLNLAFLFLGFETVVLVLVLILQFFN